VHDSDTRELADLTLSTVAISIVVHGLTSTPLMKWHERRLLVAAAGKARNRSRDRDAVAP
jgi:NhaP-type Na+/H+ or K+/H+ antiporter